MKKFIDDVQDTILTCRNSNLGQYYIDAEKLLSDFLLEEMRMKDASGISGFSGVSGYSGTSGVSGYTGVSGFTGMK